MLKSLYFKIVLILLIFIVAVMAAVGAILLNGVTSFYMDDFAAQLSDVAQVDKPPKMEGRFMTMFLAAKK